ncbi:neoverrucotoxin subunit alpha-like [Pundamilia nyererei]|uniref:Neoverrucotoxin subunit alpha-like n=1 Tax=Pundamilia nyererei TaxID=303518 RepID=A0A9Y3S0X6_9CICH|nr:PREDICTED: neoverrucotoxin subunit alpha-like [Pundamilia nyererei]
MSGNPAHGSFVYSRDQLLALRPAVELPADRHDIPSELRRKRLPKTSPPKDFNSYRPVALTSHLMKTLERLVLAKFRTCAFNTILPSVLKDKLENSGVDHHLTTWILDYLTDQPQCCFLQEFSDHLPIVGLITDGDDREYRELTHGASSVLEVAALGQPFSLGMLYDARRGKLIPGVTLWNNKTLQKKPVEHNQHSSEFHINLTDSIEKKSALLDVNGSLKASFLGGLIEVEGSAKYLNDRKKSHHQCRVTLHYKATTKFKQLMLTPDETKNSQEAKNVKRLATHVVTGILYGANAFFVFDSEKLDDSSIQIIQDSIQAILIKKITSFNVEGKVDIKLSDEEKAVTDKFTCKFYGDFILESNPATFEDAVKTYIQLPKLLGENRENCVPLKVTLMPLKKFHPKAAYMISNGFISKAEDTLQELHNLDIRCNDLLDDRVVRSFPQIQEKLSRFKKLCEYFRSSLQETMAEKLPSIRAGEKDEQELVKVFYDRDKSPFSQEKLTKWIKDEEREVTIIRYFVDMMEGTKIISDQSELDREVFKPGVEEVLCFVFTSLKSIDPYLQNMSDYLEKKKLEGTDGNTPPTQDQWYRSDEAIKQMTEKAEVVHDLAKALKNNNSFRFLVAAISNDNFKGGSIYHYRKNFLITENFSGRISMMWKMKWIGEI